ncbi:mechanosensitive ion channel family protein [Facklamia miroungae]|uniref:Small conductance mechanosensitive channel n=1 Tax=Facklamia miroungae TaxID=120956 RepID=A0A1G7P8D5_9LACT|nr:mechanosensitive ion channel family protein [Facklamia miroungae]NKZ28593.1 mechanosensitive ion channel family protein [Facklamia miroungae]SDF81690.1 small conductance mechanosensitive channel [Facklamia miroungae]
MTFFKNFFKQFQTEIDLIQISQALLIGFCKIIFSVIILYFMKKIFIKMIETYFLGKRSSRIRFAKQARNHTISRLLTNLVQYLYYFLLAYTVLSIIGVPVGTLVAGAGIVSLAIGLGAKDLVSDVVNGFFILLEHQFDVGDAVSINGYSGTVHSIGLRNTVIRDYNGTHHFIPNGSIGQMSNLSLNSIRVDIDLFIYPDQDIDQLEERLQEIYLNVPQDDQLILRDPDFLGVFRDPQGRLIYKIRIWSKSVDDMLVVQARYYKAFIQGLSEAKVKLAMGNQERVQVALNDEESTLTNESY